MNMKTKQCWVLLGLLAATFVPIDGCSAQSDQPSKVVKVHDTAGLVPEERVIKDLVGEANLELIVPNADDAIADRILDGFQSALSSLNVEDGRSVVWGFKFQEGNQQSVVIYDASGRIMLAAIVNDIVRIDDGIDPAVTTLAAYHRRILDAGANPDVIVFSHSRSELEAAFPLFKRWLQADLLGFNVDCSKTAASCALVEKVPVPVRAFITGHNGRGMEQVPLPSVVSSTIPLASFTQ